MYLYIHEHVPLPAWLKRAGRIRFDYAAPAAYHWKADNDHPDLGGLTLLHLILFTTSYTYTWQSLWSEPTRTTIRETHGSYGVDRDHAWEGTSDLVAELATSRGWLQLC